MVRQAETWTKPTETVGNVQVSALERPPTGGRSYVGAGCGGEAAKIEHPPDVTYWRAS